MREKERHLGDGVYVSYDSYGVNIAVNHHENIVVSLEPEIIVKMIQYLTEVNPYGAKNGN